MGYLTGYDDENGEVLTAIRRERQRQDDLKRKGKFAHTCADDELSRGEKLAVLMEEVGEVAREVCDDGDSARLREELVQVAAVACAWVEALDRDILKQRRSK